MRKVEFIPFVLSEEVEIYSIKYEGDSKSELEKFIFVFKDVDDLSLKKDYDEIIMTLVKMKEIGAEESFFRYEGKMKDRVCAIPIYSSKKNVKHRGTLRLYCLRLSNKLLIIGGGGEKETRSYQEDNSLRQVVETLQKIDEELMKLEREGVDMLKEIPNLVLNIK